VTMSCALTMNLPLAAQGEGRDVMRVRQGRRRPGPIDCWKPRCPWFSRR
jgi:hypothetical protein